MKDAEIQDRLRMAIQTLARGDIPGGLAHLHGLSDTLEANPPLAEVEGWIHEDDLRSRGTIIVKEGWQFPLHVYGKVERGYAVTVTIRKRELEAVG